MSRKNLEALPSADLMSLADEFGIDIPEDLNRRFLIAELLDIAREMREENDDLTIVDSVFETQDEGLVEALQNESVLPVSYNETIVSAVRSNPVWLYVYWDICASDNALIHADKSSAVILRMAVIGADGKISHAESFDVPVDIDDRDQFILLPASSAPEKNIRVELILETHSEKPRLLAASSSIALARPCPDFRESFLNGQSPLLELSGFKELMRTHFLQHRQAFS